MVSRGDSLLTNYDQYQWRLCKTSCTSVAPQWHTLVWTFSSLKVDTEIQGAGGRVLEKHWFAGAITLKIRCWEGVFILDLTLCVQLANFYWCCSSDFVTVFQTPKYDQFRHASKVVFPVLLTESQEANDNELNIELLKCLHVQGRAL